MAFVEDIVYIPEFEKVYDSSNLIALRVGAEGSAPKTRYIIPFSIELETYNVKTKTKGTITKDELLNGKMSDLLEKLVTNVYWNMRHDEASLKNETYEGPNELTKFDVPADKIAALNTAFERCNDYKNGKNVRMLASQKQARVGLDEPVKNNIGLVTFLEDNVKKGSMYIIDIVLEKDSSGGYVFR